MRRAVLLVGVLAAGLLGMAPAVVGAAPPTLNRLYAMPVQEAALEALGPGPEVFVERSPWNAIAPNYVLNTINEFGMVFYTAPQRVSKRLCSVTRGFVTWDTSGDPSAPPEDAARAEALSYSDKPLRREGAVREVRYFVAGPAPATPLAPGQGPGPLTAASQAADSCEGPVSARYTFAVQSPERAAAAVDQLVEVVRLAQGGSTLPFAVTIRCYPENHPGCDRPRQVLAGLTPPQIVLVSPLDCGVAEQVSGLEKGARSCMEVDLAAGSGNTWSVTLARNAEGALVGVAILFSPPVMI